MALMERGEESGEGVHGVEMRFLIAQDNRPTVEQLDFQRLLREEIHEVAQRLNSNVADGREKSLALTALEDALMWAGKAIFKP